MVSKTAAWASTLVAALVVSACAVSPTGRRQLSLVSENDAISASKEAYVSQISALKKEGKIVTDPQVTQRVQRITERLVAQAIQKRPETAKWEWSVQVIDDAETVNAWCMAGGRMAVYSGLLDKIDPTDDELAQVMAHEISHALANHTAERMSVALATNAGVALAGILSDNSARAAAVTAAQLAVTLPNSRTAESEADQIGVEIAARAGYNPNAAVSLWQKMEKVGGGGPPQFLSTHPSPDNREQKLAALVPQMMPLYQKARNSAPTHAVSNAVAAN